MLENAVTALLDSNNWRGLVETINNKLKSHVAAPHMYMLGHLVSGLEMTVGAEKREEDPEWFRGTSIFFSQLLVLC